MRRHLSYARYVLRHKWFVMLACFSRGLIWRGLAHDLSKLLPSEWIPYARFFHRQDGSKIQRRNPSGYYKPTDTGDPAFDFAWLLHQKRNRHHWQWWCIPEDTGGEKIFPMSHVFALEMICDWIGAGRAQGVANWQNPSPWYHRNKAKIRLHAETRLFVETVLFNL